ncbi:hypothetical protein D027_0451, partial [Vibrio parahaemolyticus 861]
RQ